MTINTPFNINTAQSILEVQAGSTNRVVTLPDGTFLAAFAADGGIFFQQYSALGAAIGQVGQFTTPGFTPGVFEIVATTNGQLVLAYSDGIDAIEVQSFRVDDGVATTTNSISTTLTNDGLIADESNFSFSGDSPVSRHGL